MGSHLIKNAQARRCAQAKRRRKQRVRAKCQGSAQRPRVSFFKSSQHIYVQVIDDQRSHTLLSASSFSKNSQRANQSRCDELGAELAARCLDAGITQVVFDRNGYPFHGRLKAFADAARKAGLQF